MYMPSFLGYTSIRRDETRCICLLVMVIQAFEGTKLDSFPFLPSLQVNTFLQKTPPFKHWAHFHFVGDFAQRILSRNTYTIVMRIMWIALDKFTAAISTATRHMYIYQIFKKDAIAPSSIFLYWFVCSRFAVVLCTCLLDVTTTKRNMMKTHKHWRNTHKHWHYA